VLIGGRRSTLLIRLSTTTVDDLAANKRDATWSGVNARIVREMFVAIAFRFMPRRRRAATGLESYGRAIYRVLDVFRIYSETSWQKTSGYGAAVYL